MSKVLLSMPDSLLEAIDARCKDRHYERSEYIRFLLRKDLFNGAPEVEEQTPKPRVVKPSVAKKEPEFITDPVNDMELRAELAEEERREQVRRKLDVGVFGTKSDN